MRYLGLLLILLGSDLGTSQEVPAPTPTKQYLKVRQQKSPSARTTSEENSLEKEKKQESKADARWTLGALLNTASFQKDTFNRPFESFGSLFLFSFPLTRLVNRTYLNGELGFGLTFSKVTLTQPSTSFTHLEFPIPATLRLLTPFSERIFGELFGGFLYRPFFYDSRDNTSGGFQGFQDERFKPEFGIGLGLAMGHSLRARIRASNFFWSAGLELLM